MSPIHGTGRPGHSMLQITTAGLVRIVTAGLVLLVVASQNSGPPDDAVRTGNQRLRNGEADAADEAYQRAESQTADPGLVAFNRGIAAIRRKEYRSAESAFRRCMGDREISDERRRFAWYNLGIALVRQAGETDVPLLRSAVESFATAVRESPAGPFREDALDNLETAKSLYWSAVNRLPPEEREKEWKDSSDRKEDRKEDRPKDQKSPDRDPTKGKDGPTDKKEKGIEKEGGPDAKKAEKKMPGGGNLPVIRDSADGPRLPSDDAEQMLRRAMNRIVRERLKAREEQSGRGVNRANDW